MTGRPMIPVNLTCRGCGWVVNGLMAATHGSAPERARADLIRALRWSNDGRRCEYCRGLERPARRRPTTVEACA